MKPKKEPEAAEPTEVQEIRSLIAAIPEVLVDRRYTHGLKPTGEVTVRAGDGPVIAYFPIDERAATRVDGVAVSNAFLGIRWIAAKALNWHRELISTTDMFEARIAQQAQEIARIDALAQGLLVERDDIRQEMIARTYCLAGSSALPVLPADWVAHDDGDELPTIGRTWSATGVQPERAVHIAAAFNKYCDWVWILHEAGVPIEVDGKISAGAATLVEAIAAGEAAVKARREAIAALQPPLDSAPVP